MQIDLRPDFSLLIIAAIFLLNYLVVRNFLFKPVNRILVERETEVGLSQRRYEESLGRFNQATADIEAKLQQARREGASVREAHRSEAVSHRAGLIERTRKEADKIINEANARLGNEVAQARERIVRESEALARLAAERILGRKLS